MTASELTRHLLVALAVVVAAAYALGWVAERIGQPRVLGELVAGIALGPSCLGALWPHASHVLLPAAIFPSLKPLADLGLVLFMFLVGNEVELDKLSGQGHRAVAISHASIVAPLALGTGLGFWLHPRLGGSTPVLPFSLFIGAAMSVTAFPVLARILKETGLDRTRLGVLTLGCAAVDDVTAWCVLAGVLALAKGEGAWAMATTAGEAIGFALVVWFVARPLLARLASVPLPLAVLFAFACAGATETIGVHAIFGAFLAGAAMPRHPADRLLVVDRIEGLTSAVLLPVFFMVVGLSTRVGLVDSWWAWGVVLLVLVVAVTGKLGGASLAARLCGESWRDASTIGILMNTRGLTEIVILSVGLDQKVLTPTMFTVMVLMALVTTLAAAPILRIVAEPGTVSVTRSRARGRSGSAPASG